MQIRNAQDFWSGILFAVFGALFIIFARAYDMGSAARMGPDPRTSVVRPDFETHQVSALYVVDSSIFPTNLGVNPQHSIMGLVTVASEQFGTNIRATATTTAPNFVRGAVVLVTTAFKAMKSPLGVTGSAMLVGAVTIVLGIASLLSLEETYGKDLDFVE